MSSSFFHKVRREIRRIVARGQGHLLVPGHPPAHRVMTGQDEDGRGTFTDLPLSVRNRHVRRSLPGYAEKMSAWLQENFGSTARANRAATRVMNRELRALDKERRKHLRAVTRYELEYLLPEDFERNLAAVKAKYTYLANQVRSKYNVSGPGYMRAGVGSWSKGPHFYEDRRVARDAIAVAVRVKGSTLADVEVAFREAYHGTKLQDAFRAIVETSTAEGMPVELATREATLVVGVKALTSALRAQGVMPREATRLAEGWARFAGA